MESIQFAPLSSSHGEATMSVPSSASTSFEETALYSKVPSWAQWMSTGILLLTFFIGLPLNGATLLIFWRRKKLRHLVNFVLLLDCLSHIILCLFCIPMHLVTEWSDSVAVFSIFPSYFGIETLSGIANLQDIAGNFVNLYSAFLTVSIAILRYRRLCWKKKDKFSTMNALKWSVSSGLLAVGVTFIQFYVVMLPESDNAIATVYLGKISLILLAVATVFFCYIRVSQRVWANTANQEKTMDPAKLKKSRSVHLKATIHSCVQIVLVVATLAPHLYLQALEMLSATGVEYSSELGGLKESHRVLSGISDSEPLSDAPHQQIFSILPNFPEQQQQPQYQHEDLSSVVADGWVEPQYSSHHQSSRDESIMQGIGDTDMIRSTFEVIKNASNSTPGESSGNANAHGIPVSIAATAAAAATLTFGASQLARLLAVTINYALLAFGTPCAYIASCHRFREQFTSILFSHAPNSPQNSTYHHGHNQSSPNHKSNRDRYHYHLRSTTGGTQDACFSSPLTRADTRTSTTVLHNQSSLMSRGSFSGRPRSAMGIGRESVSISISANTRSSFSHSFKSRSSTRKGSFGSSTKRRKSSSSAACGIVGSSVPSGGGKGLLGVSIAADSVFMESDSVLILEQDTSNGSSSTGNLNKPTQSPTTGHDEHEDEADQVSGQGSSGELVMRKHSVLASNSNSHLHTTHLTAVTTITGSNSSNLNTYLQSYGDYECGTDLGQLV